MHILIHLDSVLYHNIHEIPSRNTSRNTSRASTPTGTGPPNLTDQQSSNSFDSINNVNNSNNNNNNISNNGQSNKIEKLPPQLSRIIDVASLKVLEEERASQSPHPWINKKKQNTINISTNENNENNDNKDTNDTNDTNDINDNVIGFDINTMDNPFDIANIDNGTRSPSGSQLQSKSQSQSPRSRHSIESGSNINSNNNKRYCSHCSYFVFGFCFNLFFSLSIEV